GAVGIAAKNDGSEVYLLDPAGAVHVIETAGWTETKTYPGLVRERAIAFAQGPNAIVLARADAPIIDSIDTSDGHRDTVSLANARTGAFSSGATAMAVVPRTDFLYAIADGRVVVVDVHGLSPFAAIPTAATSLGVDGTGDTLVALGPGSADRIDTGRLPLAWRLPGVVAAALLALVLELLAGKGRNAGFLFLSFAVIPAAIYLASYAQWFGGPTAPYGWDLVELTKQMYLYHSGLTSPHPAASPWWSWPIVLKPVYWYFGQSDGGNNAYIYDAGNIALFWSALAATVWCAIAAVRARSVGLGLVVFALLVQYVAWIPISRVLFFYHFFTALPFYLLALSVWLGHLWDG